MHWGNLLVWLGLSFTTALPQHQDRSGNQFFEYHLSSETRPKRASPVLHFGGKTRYLWFK
jgi:hypothetical protein